MTWQQMADAAHAARDRLRAELEAAGITGVSISWYHDRSGGIERIEFHDVAAEHHERVREWAGKGHHRVRIHRRPA